MRDVSWQGRHISVDVNIDQLSHLFESFIEQTSFILRRRRGLIVRCLSIRRCHGVDICPIIFVVASQNTLTQRAPSSQLGRHRKPSWLDNTD
jgi:hypothetical protein